MQHADPSQFAAARTRHYGMDWLRIAAFGLLILYHIAMVFSPWHWVVKSATTYPALIAPLALLTPWRLALLFAVSGYASAKLLARQAGVAAFVRQRSARLLVPLAFGMAALVPIEMWVRVRQAGYGQGYGHFWLHDYWRSGSFFGATFPSWEHLWFVAYLWAYTVAIAAVLALGIGRGAWVTGWLAVGRRLLWMPLMLLVAAKLALMFVVPEHKGLLSDWAGHAEYLPLFVFGFVLARRPELWAAVARVARPAAIVAGLSGMVAVAVELSYPGDVVPPHAIMALDRAARLAMAWSMVLALFDLAERQLNRDHRWRAPLARAVFPAYLLHHSALILVAWWTLPLGLGAAAEFVLLLGAVSVVCWAGYALGARIGWLGTLIGMPPNQATGSSSTRSA